MGINDDIASRILSMKVGTLRAGARLGNELNDVISEAEFDIALHVSDNTGHQARSAAVIARNAARSIGDKLMDRVDEYAERRTETMLRAFEKDFGIKLNEPTRKPSLSFLRGDVSKFMEDAAVSAHERAYDAIKGGFEPEKSIARLRAHTRTVARSGANAAHNAAVLSLVRANKDQLSGVMALATLDSRTTEICQDRHGGAWDINTGRALAWSQTGIDFPGRPPWHFNCRTTLTPLVAFADVPLEETFDKEAWIRSDAGRAALGETQVSLYEQGRLTLSQLLNVR